MPHDRKQVRRGEPRETRDQRDYAAGGPRNHEEKRGPSTNRDAVPDGLEGSILDDEGPSTGSRPRSASRTPAAERIEEGSGGATSKTNGDREEGDDRTVHDL